MAVLTNGVGLLVLISAVLAASDLDSPQSIDSFSEYGRQRLCARPCFFSDDVFYYDNLGRFLSCDDPPGTAGSQNGCFCRADQQPVAVSYLSSCVSSKCGKNTVDANLATSVYLAYCTPKVAPLNQDAISTTTTAPTGTGQSGPGATQTVYVYITRGSGNRLTINFSLVLFSVKPTLFNGGLVQGTTHLSSL